ncbi:MAG: hypothetical protein KIT79_06370 [Deltaproteobacteria bacterium]|nr:hypothetical protein [Deltaproteobacteria bacterium]
MPAAELVNELYHDIDEFERRFIRVRHRLHYIQECFLQLRAYEGKPVASNMLFFMFWDSYAQLFIHLASLQKSLEVGLFNKLRANPQILRCKSEDEIPDKAIYGEVPPPHRKLIAEACRSKFQELFGTAGHSGTTTECRGATKKDVDNLLQKFTNRFADIRNFRNISAHPFEQMPTGKQIMQRGVDISDLVQIADQMCKDIECIRFLLKHHDCHFRPPDEDVPAIVRTFVAAMFGELEEPKS